MKKKQLELFVKKRYQILSQLVEWYLQHQSQINYGVILSIVLSSINFLVLLIKLISINPSTISQKEFDLINMKKKETFEKYKKNLWAYEKQLVKHKQIEQFKFIKSNEYYLKLLKDQKLQQNQIVKQMENIDKLRKCDYNLKSLIDLFGNDKLDEVGMFNGKTN